MQYVDAENHTWTTDDFFKAMDAVYAHTGQTVGAVYCSGQGGDQGTRASSTTFTVEHSQTQNHTKYTADLRRTVKAIQALVDSKAIGFDASIAGGDEINLFRQGVLNVAFCWNIAQQLNADNNDAGLTNDGDEILFMAFPSEKATDTKLCGGIWGLVYLITKMQTRSKHLNSLLNTWQTVQKEHQTQFFLLHTSRYVIL